MDIQYGLLRSKVNKSVNSFGPIPMYVSLKYNLCQDINTDSISIYTPVAVAVVVVGKAGLYSIMYADPTNYNDNIIFNPFNPIHLTRNRPFSHSDQSVYHNQIQTSPFKRCVNFCYVKYGRILANSADPDETARMSRPIWIYTVCKHRLLKRPLGFTGLIVQYSNLSLGRISCINDTQVNVHILRILFKGILRRLNTTFRVYLTYIIKHVLNKAKIHSLCRCVFIPRVSPYIKS